MSNDRVSEIVNVSRRAHHEAYAAAMAEGRRQRAHKFRPAKGKGSYRRKAKHSKGREGY